MSNNTTDNDVATADQVDGAVARLGSNSFHSYKEVRAACRDFADRANKIEHRANEAARGVKPLMLRQVQLARAIDEVLGQIRHLAEHYKRMDNFAAKLLLPHNYILSDRMMNDNVSEHYLWMTADFLKDATSGLQEAEKLVEAQEYMEHRREQVHEAVAKIQQLTAAASKLARELDGFVPRVATFFHGLKCGCAPEEGCFEHEWEPKSKIDRNIRRLDDKTADILANLDTLLKRLASDAGKRPASPRGENGGPDPLAGVYQAKIDSCVIGSCCVCSKDDHATTVCPMAQGEISSHRPQDDNFYLMSGALQTEGEDEIMASGAF